jgi:integrase
MSNVIGHDKSKFNIGKWMAAKIYSDVKNNVCDRCGGKYCKYVEYFRRDKKPLAYPVCDSCNYPPKRFRIRAKLIDQSGKKKYVFVRKTADNKRYLEELEDVIDVFKKVETEEANGKFRYTDYDKKTVREKDLFKNVVEAYLKIQAQRSDLSPYSLDSKRKYLKILVNGVLSEDGVTKTHDGFGEISVHDIEGHHVEDFKLFLKSYSNQAMCLGTMKTIMKWAFERYKIARPIYFEVPSSKKRKIVPDLAITSEKIIPSIENETHREAIRMLEHYGLRPSEVRAIQYEQIDLIKDRIIIDRHFSKTTLLMGRKSASEGEDTGSLDRPLSPELKAFIKSRPWPLDKKRFLFTNSVGKPLGVKDLSQTWRETLKKLKLPHIEMYGLRGARITKVIKEKGIKKGRDFAGHSDIKTTMRNYDHSDRNVDDCFA